MKTALIRRRRGGSALALYAANGLRPTFVLDPSLQKYFTDGSPTNLAGAVTHARASGATYLDSSGILQTSASGEIRDQAYAYVDGVLTGPYLQHESAAATNLLHNTDALVTQTETVTAQPYTLHFTGTGTVTLSGASTAGPLVGTGTGENNRVSLTFTPSAGTLTLTVSGTVTNAQLEAGSIPTSYIPNLAASGSVSRAAETLTIPTPPWPATITGTELVTNGTFDTDTDWTKGSGWTISGGSASNDGTINAIYQPKEIQAGKLYVCTIDITFNTPGVAYWRLGNTTNLGVMSINATSYAQYLVGSADGNYIGIFTNASVSIDNISVKEITPRAIGISMKGLMTGENSTFSDWTLDANNGIQITSGASDFTFTQEAASVVDSVTGGSYASGINVPFSIASRHGDNFINGAVDGTALTADLTPTILPDLSTTPIQIRAAGGPIYLEEMRIWVEGAVDKITDALIEEASA